ncbi:unnamed protein product [Phyllotreta striolata]|uniref:Protein DP71L n=1 Tax=Phyllotreta striolata TaxID=444603 RepID=A0A9N9XTG3_PHYSR|nr:unnamed protein product [Phyllotreta striolata]
MWNIPKSIAPILAPFKTQKRELASFSIPHAAIHSDKVFKNPNFVNNHPNVHCSYSSTNPICRAVHNFCQDSDTTDSVIENPCTGNHTNFSRKPTEDLEVETAHRSPITRSSFNTSRKRSKKSRKNRRKKSLKQNSKRINEMMDVDSEMDTSMNRCDNLTCPASPKSLQLSDFLVEFTEIPARPIRPEQELYTFISISPPSNGRLFNRERELSVCESEDSFIVFDSGTDEELKFSESENETDSDTEDSSDDSDVDDDFDSSNSVVPCKRVRFADKEDLCEIHPMVQWSFAYRSARKGPWEEYARDRERFNKRISRTEQILGPVFNRQHRENVYKERFDRESVEK